MLSFLSKNILLLFITLMFLFLSPHAHAAALKTVSDIISTSRPSPLTTLATNMSSGDNLATVVANNATFLASDSASFSDSVSEHLTIASISGTKTTLYFSSPATASHTNGVTIASLMTSVHVITFTTQTLIPLGGSITITFPSSNASDTNQSMPSNSTFMFNNLLPSNIQANFSAGSSYCAFAISGTSAGGTPTITCTVQNAALAPSTTVTILIGCSAPGTTCPIVKQIPTLINPTKSATIGTADIWKINLKTTDSLSNILDSATGKVGTIESVSLHAHIDPTFTFRINGVGNATSLSSFCTNGGINNDMTNSGFATTATDVNLGILLPTQINIAAQQLTIMANSISGYTIIATSSGHLLNSANGAFLQDAQGTPTGNNKPTPSSSSLITSGSNKFGIHPCDLVSQSKINTFTWGSGSNNYFANPSSYYYSLVNSASNTAVSGDTYYVEYGASAGINTLPGTYNTQITYIASTVF